MWVATVDFMNAFDSRSHQSLWKALEERYRITLHQPPEEALRGTDRDSLNGQRKRHVWDEEENEAGGSSVQLSVQHGAPNGNERRHVTLAKDERHGHMLRWSWVWLPHKPAFCWRRALVLHFAESAPKVICDFKKSTGNVGLKDHQTRLKFWTTKWRSTTSKLRYYLRVRVRNILGKQLHFSNRKQQRSKIEAERPGQRSTDTNKSWDQDRTSYNTDSAYST